MTVMELIDMLDGAGLVVEDESAILDALNAAGILQTDTINVNGPETCQRCGSPLVNGYCTDETCPYSDHKQDATITYG